MACALRRVPPHTHLQQPGSRTSKGGARVTLQHGLSMLCQLNACATIYLSTGYGVNVSLA